MNIINKAKPQRGTRYRPDGYLLQSEMCHVPAPLARIQKRGPQR